MSLAWKSTSKRPSIVHVINTYLYSVLVFWFRNHHIPLQNTWIYWTLLLFMFVDANKSGSGGGDCTIAIQNSPVLWWHKVWHGLHSQCTVPRALVRCINGKIVFGSLPAYTKAIYLWMYRRANVFVDGIYGGGGGVCVEAAQYSQMKAVMMMITLTSVP